MHNKTNDQLTKHFYKLEEFILFPGDIETQEEFYNEILKLENMIHTKSLDYFGNQLRKTAEKLFFESFDFLECSFAEMPNELKEHDWTLSFPTNVYSSFHYIKRLGNDQSHSRRREKAYEIALSPSNAIVAMQSLFILTKWVLLKVRGEVGASRVNFSHEEYEKTKNIEKNINKDLNNPNNDLRPHLLSLSQLVMAKGYKFNIPTYQRDYTWKEENITKLLFDLEQREQDKKTHYFGSIAVASDEENKTLRIIDGQQRITTTLIFLKAFAEEFKKVPQSIPEELEEFINKKLADIYLNQMVMTSQKEVSRLLKDKLLIKTDNKSNPYKNFWKIREFLEDKTIEEIRSLYNVFVTRINAAVLIFKTTIDNEMDIFENLNTGGKSLSGPDLIKNYLFSRLRVDIFEENEEFINKRVVNYMNGSRLSPNANKSNDKNLSKFFIAYDRLMSIQQKGEVLSSRDEYKVFKTIWPSKNVNKFESFEEYMEEINQLIIYFNIYREIQIGYKYNDSKLHSFSHILDLVVKEDVMPLLMFWMEKCSVFDEKQNFKTINRGKFWRLLRALECYFIRTDVYGNSQSKNFDKFLNDNFETSENLGDKFLKYAQTSDFGKTMPPISEFIKHYSSNGDINAKKIKNMCINAELKLRGDSIQSTRYVSFENTHEHILAQRLAYEDYGVDIPREEFENKMLIWKNSIGNALILGTGLNSKAGNKPFWEKINTYEKSNSALSKGKPSVIMDLHNKEVFTFDDIKLRSKQLAKFLSDVYETIGEF